jgi:hypothetical protein
VNLAATSFGHKIAAELTGAQACDGWVPRPRARGHGRPGTVLRDWPTYGKSTKKHTSDPIRGSVEGRQKCRGDRPPRLRERRHDRPETRHRPVQATLRGDRLPRGYEDAATTDRTRQAEAVSLFISDMLCGWWRPQLRCNSRAVQPCCVVTRGLACGALVGQPKTGRTTPFFHPPRSFFSIQRTHPKGTRRSGLTNRFRALCSPREGQNMVTSAERMRALRERRAPRTPQIEDRGERGGQEF